MLQFTVLGISDEAQPLLSPHILDTISSCRVFTGGRRHHDLVRPYLPEEYTWIDITVPLEAVFDQYRSLDQHIMVFASGDPLFFGYTTTLMREFPGLVRETVPYFNSLQLLAHALRLPYHDMRVVSLTGRPWDEFERAIVERTHKLGVLTDKKNTPAVIAQRLLDFGYDTYTMHIGVRLGGERQELYSLPLTEVVARGEFNHPNCLILEATKPLGYAPRLGLPEGEFHLLNGRAKMITKMPIRLLSLTYLDLHERREFWDVGFCTGSVSVEAKLQFPHLRVTSFEIRPEGDELMTTNSRRFGAMGIRHFVGDFLEQDVTDLPRPEAVFIGGHGGKLKEFLVKLTALMDERGIIVFNSVSTETLDLFRQGIAEVGWRITNQMHIALDEHNPITILQARP